jgi:hypothetical protein
MTCISRSVGFYKRTLPVLLFIALVVITAFAATDMVRGDSRLSSSELLVPWVFGLVGWLFMWLNTSGVADEVLDEGDHLLVRVGSRSAQVSLLDIASVSESAFFNPRRITLRLTRPGPLGSAIVFMPAIDVAHLVPLERSRVTDDLEHRVERAHRGLPS